MPDWLLGAYDPSKLVDVSMQATGFRQLCSSPLFRPREVHFRTDMLDSIYRDKGLHGGLAAATHVLACFPHVRSTHAHRTEERMRAALAVLPTVTHLALHIPADARTHGMYRLNERIIEPPNFMLCTLETALREKRIVVLVVNVTELDESHQKDTEELIRELADDRVRMLVDNRPRYLRWENDWQLGRGVWDGHESV